jgi:hypothetical protein
MKLVVSAGRLPERRLDLAIVNRKLLPPPATDSCRRHLISNSTDGAVAAAA